MKKKVLIIISLVLLFLIINFAGGKVIDTGLKKYFGLDKHAEVLLVGHSHLMLAVDKSRMEKELGLDIAKYCREGVPVDVREYMIKHYLSLPESDSLKIILYGADQFMFNPNNLSNGSYTLFYPFIDSPAIDSLIRKEASPKEYWSHRLIKLSNYSDALLNSSIRGYMGNWENFKSGVLDTVAMRESLKKGYNRPIIFDTNLKTAFERTLELIKAKGIHIVLVNTPIVKELNELQPKEYAIFQNYMDSLDASSPLIHYWDINPGMSDKYLLFYDMIHLNHSGQIVATDSITSRFKHEFLNKRTN